jgi:MFS family permease
MIDLSKRSWLKYLLFGDIYFANGFQGALAVTIVIVYFTEKNISIAIATMVAGISSIPFTLKFLFGPLSDYFIKYGRKPFVVIGVFISAISFFPLAFIDPTVALLPFTVLLFLGCVGVVIFDIAADAWAIQITTENDRGKVNAAMFGSLFGGMAIGNVLLSFVAKYYSYPMTFIVAGIISLLLMVVPLLVKEIKIIKERPKIARLLLVEFQKKNTLLIALFGLISAMNFGMILFIMPQYMMHVLHLDVAQIGLLASLFPIATVIGAVTGGVLADKWGRKNTLYLFLSGMLVFSALLITANTWQMIAILYPMIGFLQGAACFSALMALFMDITNPTIGASQYSILTSISNLGDYSVAIVSGTLVLLLGYQRFFLYAGWVVGPALLLLYFVKEKQDEQKITTP